LSQRREGEEAQGGRGEEEEGPRRRRCQGRRRQGLGEAGQGRRRQHQARAYLRPGQAERPVERFRAPHRRRTPPPRLNEVVKQGLALGGPEEAIHPPCVACPATLHLAAGDLDGQGAATDPLLSGLQSCSCRV
jgi:hypothetical protein